MDSSFVSSCQIILFISQFVFDFHHQQFSVHSCAIFVPDRDTVNITTRPGGRERAPFSEVESFSAGNVVRKMSAAFLRLPPAAAHTRWEQVKKDARAQK